MNRNQTEFAELLNITFATVNRWENGRAVPNKLAQSKMYELCKEYNIPCIDVFHNCGWSQINVADYTSHDGYGEGGVGDEIHPNELGHKRIGSIIVDGFIKNII